MDFNRARQSTVAADVRWLHDACLRDLLDQAGVSVGRPPAEPARWSPCVRLLRRLAPRRPALSQ